MIALAIDVILVLVLVEGAALVWLHRRTGRGIPPVSLLPNLAAGFFLMLAVRLALATAGDGPIALCLMLALVAHLRDLIVRWRRRRSPVQSSGDI